jgi:hypothetical protein
MRWVEKIAHGCEYCPFLEDQRAIVVVCSHIQIDFIKKNGERRKKISCS